MRYMLSLALVVMALLMRLPCRAEGPDGSDGGQGGIIRMKVGARVPVRRARPEPVTLMGAAFADAREILSADNPCSDFFGGAERAVAVLDGLSERVIFKGLTDRRLGIRMTGAEDIFISHRTGYQYRLFRQVIINTNGPFYSGGDALRPIPPCGSFPPNTREARVLMLLHELGHLIKGGDGQWLLSDDGHDYQRSLTNTSRVEARCAAQIRALQPN